MTTIDCFLTGSGQHYAKRQCRVMWKKQIRRHEKAMLELLHLAVGIESGTSVSGVAAAALMAVMREGDHELPNGEICLAAANKIRQQCVVLGVPAQRYLNDEWQILGFSKC
jgi:hypothetical protein